MKRGCISIITLLVLILLFSSRDAVAERQTLRAAQAVGELSFQPASLSQPVSLGQSFSVNVAVNIGSTYEFSIARLDILFDQTILQVTECTSDFGTIFGGPPCIFDNSAGTIKLQPVIGGGNGTIVLVHITFTSIANGTAQATITSYEIVVQDQNGYSIQFPVSVVGSGSYQIGTGAILHKGINLTFNTQHKLAKKRS